MYSICGYKKMDRLILKWQEYRYTNNLHGWFSFKSSNQPINQLKVVACHKGQYGFYNSITQPNTNDDAQIFPENFLFCIFTPVFVSDLVRNYRVSIFPTTNCGLISRPCDRNVKDVELISARLRRVEQLCKLPNSVLQQLALCGYYEDLEKGVTCKFVSSQYIDVKNIFFLWSVKIFISEKIPKRTLHLPFFAALKNFSIDRKLEPSNWAAV